MSLSSCEILSIDFETTGVVPGHRNIAWQIGVVPVVSGQVRADLSYVSYLRVPSDHPFNPYAPGRWASLRQELSLSPSLIDLWPDIGEALVHSCLCAHNAATERGILTAAYPMQSFGRWIDTLAIARRVIPGLRDYKLRSVVERLGLSAEVELAFPGRDYHDALFDAGAAAHVLCWLMRQEGWRGVTLEQLSSIK